MTTELQNEYYDNTRLSDHRRCNRYFYYRHVRGWRREGVSLPLAFGLAWHSAMDAVWNAIGNDNDKDDEHVRNLGYMAFELSWIQSGLKSLEETDDIEMDRLKARNPMTAMEMLFNYIQQRREFIESNTIIAIEQPFAVPLYSDNNELLYIGRIDKTIEKPNGDIYGIEHKTSSLYRVNGPFATIWIDSFSPNSQIDGYLHALHMLYGKRAKGILVDGALVHKNVHDAFRFIPVERQTIQLDAWLYDTKVEIKRVKENKYNNAMHIEDNIEKYLPAFPKNTANCISFNTACPYQDLCKMWNDPTNKETPPGFITEYWEPFDLLGIDQLGIEQDEKK